MRRDDDLRGAAAVRRAVIWSAAVAWAALIFALSSVPARSLGPPPFPHADKVVHFGLYLVLAALLCAALGQVARSGRLTTVAALALVVAALYGASDELHQRHVIGRDRRRGERLPAAIHT
ncbi:MAG: VanZ family protein, partial [Actinomycetota bacterium]